MCIAVSKPADITVSAEVWKCCFANNSDGAGFAYVQDGKVKIEKGFFTFSSFYEAFKPHEAEKAIVHFRIRSHGEVCQENCHPFQVTDEIAFIHNGIIPGHGNVKSQSDTLSFNETIVKPLVASYGWDGLKHPSVKTIIEAYVGRSKLVFLNGAGETLYFNKQWGNFSADKVWFSNMSWVPQKPLPKSLSLPLSDFECGDLVGVTSNLYDYTFTNGVYHRKMMVETGRIGFVEEVGPYRAKVWFDDVCLFTPNHQLRHLSLEEEQNFLKGDLI